MTRGLQSTEFLAMVFAMLVALLSGWLGIDPEQVWAVVASAGVYGGARGVAKIGNGTS